MTLTMTDHYSHDRDRDRDHDHDHDLCLLIPLYSFEFIFCDTKNLEKSKLTEPCSYYFKLGILNKYFLLYF